MVFSQAAVTCAESAAELDATESTNLVRLSENVASAVLLKTRLSVVVWSSACACSWPVRGARFCGVLGRKILSLAAGV